MIELTFSYRCAPDNNWSEKNVDKSDTDLELAIIWLLATGPGKSRSMSYWLTDFEELSRGGEAPTFGLLNGRQITSDER